jgi:protein O-mannosyl-transferase
LFNITWKLLLMKKNYTYLIIIFIIVASYAAFGRIAVNDFINWDDTGYITENYHVQSGISLQNIKWAFTAVMMSNWHPLTWLSHTLDWSLYGDNPSGHHLVSLLLHIGAAIFLFLFLYKATKNVWPSVFAAALFALHPLRVESVAWVAERKDVLSMFFGLASIFVYAFYAENNKLSKYLFCLILFILSLMSKPILVTLPFVLLLLDYWPLGRWQKALSSPAENRPYSAGRLILEKTPFFLLTIASSIVTYWAQNKDSSVTSPGVLPIVTQVANASVSYVAYLEKTFWPFNLAVFYPYEFHLTLGEISTSGFILIIITAVVLYYIKNLPFLFTGWFWYLGTLIPVIGLVQVGRQAMADRYTYLPSIGIAIMLSWSIPLLFPREDIRKKILFPAGIVVLVILSFLTWQQCGYWKNSATLFNHALRMTKDNYIAYNCYGLALFEEGKIEQAIDYYNQAIRISPDYADAFNNKGTAYSKLGRYQRAIEDYNQAIRLKQNSAWYYYNRGLANNKLGLYQRAIEDYNQAIRITPDYAEAFNNKGTVYGELGRYQLAIESFNKAIALKQDYVEAYSNRGFTYLLQDNNKLGCPDAQKACALRNCKTLEWAKRKGSCR